MFAKKLKQTRFLFLKRSLENEKNIHRARSSPGNHSSKRKFETQTSSMRNNVLEKKTVQGKSLKIEKPQTFTALSWKRRSRNKKSLNARPCKRKQVQIYGPWDESTVQHGDMVHYLARKTTKRKRGGGV